MRTVVALALMMLIAGGIGLLINGGIASSLAAPTFPGCADVLSNDGDDSAVTLTVRFDLDCWRNRLGTPTATAIPTATATPLPATPTATAVLPTPTRTATPIVPTATRTATRTATPLLPTPTAIPGSVWRPALNTSWHWMIDHPLRLTNAKDMGLADPNGNTLTQPAPQVYDIDYEFNTAATVAALHAQGKRVIAYMDLGVYEDYRADAGRFPKSVIGKPDGNWEGSYWLDIRQLDILLPIMRDRMLLAKSKSFDAIEPDEICGYSNDTGFPLTYNDQLVYNRALADMAHEMGMSIGLKGDIEQSRDLEPWFDWALIEECYQYKECHDYGLDRFIQAGKAVFIAEYKGALTGFCPDANASNYNAVKFPLNLNGGRWPCR